MHLQAISLKMIVPENGMLLSICILQGRNEDVEITLIQIQVIEFIIT